MRGREDRGRRAEGARQAAACHSVTSPPPTLETQQRSSPSMPRPKSTPKPGRPPLAPREVVPLGRRDVFKNSGDGRPETFRERPTTTKAVVLRNGKYGAMGTGELVLLSKIGGREKLDLLAGTRLCHQQYSDNPNLDTRSPLMHRGLYRKGGESSRDSFQIGTMCQDRRVSAKRCLIPVPL